MPEVSTIRIETSPQLCFVVIDWAVADSFEDFLSEVADLKCATEFVEADGRFVLRRFFPLAAVREEQMKDIVQRFRHEKPD